MVVVVVWLLGEEERDNVDEEQLSRPGKWNLKFIRNYMVIFGIHSSIFDVLTFCTLLYVLKVKESASKLGGL